MKRRLFQLIDLDRTLFDTSKFAKAITDEVNKTEPGLGTELDARFEEAYAREETFFVLRYLRKHLGDEGFMNLVDKVIARHGRDAFKIAGFEERIALANELTDVRPSYGIFTFGDEPDQYLKLSIIGLQDAPIYFTESADKAPVIASWQQEDGTFILPKVFGGHRVEMLSFEDDKSRAFSQLPKGVMGIWLTKASDAAEHAKTLGASELYIKPSLIASTELLHTIFK